MDSLSDAAMNCDSDPSVGLTRTWQQHQQQQQDYPGVSLRAPPHRQPKSRHAPYFAGNLLHSSRHNRARDARSSAAGAPTTTAVTAEHATPLFAAGGGIAAPSAPSSSSAPDHDHPSPSDEDDDPLGSYVFPGPSAAPPPALPSLQPQFAGLTSSRDLAQGPSTLDSFGFAGAQRPHDLLRPATALPQTEANLRRHLHQPQRHRKSHSLNTVPTLSPPSAADLSPPSSAASVDAHLQSPLVHVPRLLGVADLSLGTPPIRQIQHILTEGAADGSASRIASSETHNALTSYGFGNLDGALGDVPAIRKISGMTDLSAQSESSGETIRAGGEHTAVAAGATHASVGHYRPESNMSQHPHTYKRTHSYDDRGTHDDWVGSGYRISKLGIEGRVGPSDTSRPSPHQPHVGVLASNGGDGTGQSDTLRGPGGPSSPRQPSYLHPSSRQPRNDPFSSLPSLHDPDSRDMQSVPSLVTSDYRFGSVDTNLPPLHPSHHHPQSHHDGALPPDLANSFVSASFPDDSSSSDPPNYGGASGSDGSTSRRKSQKLASLPENRAVLFGSRGRGGSRDYANASAMGSMEANKQDKNAIINLLPVDETLELSSLRDGPDGPDGRPGYPYVVLIRYAILGSQRGKLTLQELYEAIMDRFPWYRKAGKGWMNSVRHNLSLNKCFVREPRHILDPGKGSYWTVDLNAELSTSRARDRKRAGSKRKLSSFGAGDGSNEDDSNQGFDEHTLSGDEVDVAHDGGKNVAGSSPKKRRTSSVKTSMPRSTGFKFDEPSVINSPARGSLLPGPPMTPESPIYAHFQPMEGSNLYPMSVHEVQPGSTRMGGDYVGRNPSHGVVRRPARSNTVNSSPYGRPPGLSSPSVDAVPHSAHTLVTPPSETSNMYQRQGGNIPYHPTSPQFAPFGYSRLPHEHSAWPSQGQGHQQMVETAGSIAMNRTDAYHSQSTGYHHATPVTSNHRGNGDARYHLQQPSPFSPSFSLPHHPNSSSSSSSMMNGNGGKSNAAGSYGNFPRMLSSPIPASTGLTTTHATTVPTRSGVSHHDSDGNGMMGSFGGHHSGSTPPPPGTSTSRNEYRPHVSFAHDSRRESHHHHHHHQQGGEVEDRRGSGVESGSNTC